MAISSALPTVNPFPVQPTTGRGTIQPVTGSESRDIAESRNPETARATDEAPEARGERGEKQRSDSAGDQTGQNGQQLDEAQLKELRELKARDREVRAHEQAHQAVGGQYAGSISYTYERGPDGNQYAVGGEVSIDTSPVQGDPQATIEKMRTVRAAALAPAEPSGQDRAVAAEAMQLMLQAQMEMSSESRETGEASPDRESGRSQSISASNAYRDVSGMVDPASGRAAFQAVA
ncbi:putative metalloprotease CJM1_0395 family protein [Marinobacter sp. M1N3S26]|uniref:putative metalloprotease CJM1_0395 family protein n=1 Tax=Marinobacter sp. M1N3S26 TaxID=3382299 RepID=UPI00387B3D9D